MLSTQGDHHHPPPPPPHLTNFTVEIESEYGKRPSAWSMGHINNDMFYQQTINSLRNTLLILLQI